MDIKAALTVVGDGPVGPVGRELDEVFGMPSGHHVRDWAVGMKAVVSLPEGVDLPVGTVFHMMGYPEPEIFGFFYVHPDRMASVGIFVPSWFDSPVRTAYRYLQHFMLHPYLWRYLDGATLLSWGAKSLQESGKQGEPYLAGNGYARIGEGSGSTNVLTGSGVDEAWTTGTLLADGVFELLRTGKSFTRENLEAAYVERRRRSWVEKEGRVAEHARDGFQRGFIQGLIGMGLAGLTGGRISLHANIKEPHERIQEPEDYFRGKFSHEEIEAIRKRCLATNQSLHDGDQPVRSLDEFGLCRFGVHLLVSAEREVVHARLQVHATQSTPNLLFIGKLLVVAVMVRQNHVKNGTGDKHNNRRQQDRKPELGKRDHSQTPPMD